jgi:hypothetical protein
MLRCFPPTPLSGLDDGELVQHLAKQGVIGIQGLFAKCKGTPVERLRLRQAPDTLIIRSEGIDFRQKQVARLSRVHLGQHQISLAKRNGVLIAVQTFVESGQIPTQDAHRSIVGPRGGFYQCQALLPQCDGIVHAATLLVNIS